MTTYYVRKTGSDSNTTVQAQNPSTPWLTIDKAANEVAAGDIVYVGAGTYRETVTMDTSGSSGSPIKFIADVTGEQTGDAGLVVISAFDDPNTCTRTSCWNPNDGKTFIEVYDFVMQGGLFAIVYDGTSTSNNNYEGVVFDGCVFAAGPGSSDGAFDIHLNAGTTPTTPGLKITNCVFTCGGIQVKWDGNETADQDLKIEISNCLFTGSGAATVEQRALLWDLASAGTFASGGVSFTNNTVIGLYYGIYVDDGTSTTYPIDVRNCYFACLNVLNKLTSNDGAITSDYNTFVGTLVNVTNGPNDRDGRAAVLLGGLHDHPLIRKWGWSPYLPWEPMSPPNVSGVADMWSSLIADGSSTDAPATDLYGNPRPGGVRGMTSSYYYFDASDAGPTDNEAVWTNDANGFDGDTTTTTSCSTAGSPTSNEIRGEGTNAPASGSEILQVEVRFHRQPTGTLNFNIYTDGEAEEVSPPISMSGGSGWSSWYTMSVPTGGWTWPKVQALELVSWAAIQPVEWSVAQVRVDYISDPADDRGAVEARARAIPETTTVRTGSTAARFDGAGRHSFPIPVAAASTTVSVYAYTDTTYTGTNPQLKVSRIPGVADQTDTHNGVDDTWDLLSVNFTPTSAGVALVELISNDTSPDGQCFFDDLTVT